MSKDRPEQVEPMDPEKETSDVIAKCGDDCYWNGQRYSHGSRICVGNQRLQCFYGRWVNDGSC